MNVRERLEWLLTRVWFRLIAAALLVWMQLSSVEGFALERFGTKFNAFPDNVPAFKDPHRESHVPFAKRLIVSRWDAEHYIAIALRGYTMCPPAPLTKEMIKRADPTCNVTFFAGYPMIGRMMRALTHQPIDYSLWYVSLLASFLTFFLWTSRTMTERLGVGATWISLAALNAYPTACYFVFIVTEPCAILFTFASYLAFARKEYLLSALLAGASSAMRITGVATSMAFSLALFVETVRRPPSKLEIAARALFVPLSAWGLLSIMGYFWYRFDDPRLYQHAHEVIYSHSATIDEFLHPDPGWFVHALDDTMHDGVWVGGLVLWFALGHRVAFRKFPTGEQVFLYTLVAMTLAISLVGSLSRHMEAMSRYAMLAFPFFLAIGAFLKRRWFVLALWLFVCRWHSREVDTCYYLGDVGPQGLRKCNMTQWLDY